MGSINSDSGQIEASDPPGAFLNPTWTRLATLPLTVGSIWFSETRAGPALSLISLSLSLGLTFSSFCMQSGAESAAARLVQEGLFHGTSVQHKLRVFIEPMVATHRTCRAWRWGGRGQQGGGGQQARPSTCQTGLALRSTTGRDRGTSQRGGDGLSHLTGLQGAWQVSG